MPKESKIEEIKKSKEEEMEEQQAKSKESKEKEKLPPVFMIYRDNDLFKEATPKIAETLKRLGREVEIQSFPQGTNKNDIEEWIRQHQKEFENKQLLMDGTCDRVMKLSDDPNLRALEKNSGLSTLFNKGHNEFLDLLTDDAAAEALLGEEYEEMLDYTPRGEEKSRAYAEKAIPIIVSRILEKKNNVPDIVEIYQTCLTDHAPLSEFCDFGKDLDKATERVKEWLVKGGIPRDIIQKRGVYDDAETMMARRKKILEAVKRKLTMWIIVDRHADRHAYEEDRRVVRDIEDSREIYLHLPLGNFFGDAVKNDLLALKPEDLQRYNQILEKKIQEYSARAAQETKEGK